ncbi:MAG: DUF541 domain-containing protein [Planctomycetes bacterium]|nr:DUF541 domain-containing protein [Planctomycetota bacterium]
MKTTIAAVMVSVVACVSGATEIPDYPFVYAEGSVTARIAPDMCCVSYTVRIRDRDSANAIKMVESRSAETISMLVNHGVKKDDIVGHEIEKDVVREQAERDTLAILGYEIRRVIRFPLRDLKQYDPIVSALLKTDNVVNVFTAFDRTDRDDVESRLLSEAVAKAKAKAELMAKGAGQQIVKLRAISQRGFQNFGEQFGLGNRSYGFFNSLESSPREELLFVPSSIEFSNSVSVIYELTEVK